MKRTTRDLEQGIGRLSAGGGGGGRLNRQGKTTGPIKKLEPETPRTEAEQSFRVTPTATSKNPMDVNDIASKLGKGKSSYDMGAGEYSSHISDITKYLLPKKFKKGGMVGRDYCK